MERICEKRKKDGLHGKLKKKFILLICSWKQHA
jgi:hypothetical protein